MKRDLHETAKRSPVNRVEPAETEESIRRRAYELYEQRGRGDGLELDDWVHAEAELQSSRKSAKAA